MEVRPGYKQADVGAIPEEWSVCSFDEVCRRLNAKPHQIQTSEYQRTGLLPVVDQGQKAIVGYTDRIDRKFRCPDDGVIVFGDHTCVVKFVDFDFAVGADGTQLIGARAGDSTRFHAYGLELHGVVSTGYNRHFKFLRERLFVRPPLPEQRAIASALSDVDALLDGLERLIAKKRDLKQAAMQQLLNGQTRLPGFHGEWEVKRLGDLMRFQVGFPFSSTYFNEKGDGIRLVKNRDLKSDDQIFHYTGKFDQAFIVRNGDVLVGMDGEFRPCKWNKGKALLNQRVGKIVPLAGLDATFAYYFLKEPLQDIEDVTSSTTVKHLSHGDVEEIERQLPEVSEQTAIAKVLSDMDTELTALEARRDKTLALKQGMMQELLTGRTRLV